MKVTVTIDSMICKLKIILRGFCVMRTSSHTSPVSVLWEGVSQIMSERENGVVKWFNLQKGFGFIERENGPDVFVHYSAIQGAGYRELNEGDHVEFSITQGPKGLQASEVMRVNN